MTAKVSFELTKEGKITIEVKGNKAAVKAGLLSIVREWQILKKYQWKTILMR